MRRVHDRMGRRPTRPMATHGGLAGISAWAARQKWQERFGQRGASPGACPGTRLAVAALVVPLPSRGGLRMSSLYRLEATTVPRTLRLPPGVIEVLGRVELPTEDCASAAILVSWRSAARWLVAVTEISEELWVSSHAVLLPQQLTRTQPAARSRESLWQRLGNHFASSSST